MRFERKAWYKNTAGITDSELKANFPLNKRGSFQIRTLFVTAVSERRQSVSGAPYCNISTVLRSERLRGRVNSNKVLAVTDR